MPGRHRGQVEVQLQPYSILALPHSDCFTPWKDTWYSLYRRLDGPWDRSGWVCKVSQWGLNPRPSNLWCVAVWTMPSHPPIYQSYTIKISTLLKCFVIADIETIFYISKSVLVLSKALHHVHACSSWPYTYFVHVHQLVMSSYCCSTLHLHKFNQTAYFSILTWLH
jgi:hypothetical protein